MWVPKAVAALALGMLVSTSALHAQGAEFSLGGGVDLPLGDFDDVAKLGFHGLAGVSVVPANWPVGIQVDGSYSQFRDDTPLDVKFQLIYGTANIVYKFKTSEESRFRPYLIGGGGVYNFKVEGRRRPQRHRRLGDQVRHQRRRGLRHQGGQRRPVRRGPVP